VIPYVPFSAGPYRIQMGLSALDLDDWIQIDGNYRAEIDERLRLLGTRHGEVFDALPGSTAMGAELLALLAEHLPRRFPERFARDGDVLVDRIDGRRHDLKAPGLHPLDLAGRLVQEDLCLMASPAAGEPYVLVAASLCFPSRWRLADKIGRPLRAIHGPTPFFNEKLLAPVERFFANLTVERPMVRTNWSIHDDPALFQPQGHGDRPADPPITVDNVGARLFLRSERQTLRRLPATGAVLFTIRTYQCPVAEVAADPARAGDLAAAVEAFPPETLAYKGLTQHKAALLAYLARMAAA
jgi:hypothetical protein